MTIHTEKIILHEDRNVSLVAMVQDCGGEFGKITARPAVLILPGGGYSMCSDREAEPVAYPYLAAGYQAFVLRYSIGEHKAWPNPLNDYEEAMTMIRGKAEEWHIIPDRIAVIGFSAGGHLAAAAATSAINRPNAAILGYAATGRPLTDAMHPVHKAVVPNEAVDDQTCPCFIFAARDDTMVPVEENSVPFMQALAEHAIMYEDEEGTEPFVGIVGYCGNIFENTYGRSEDVSKDSVLQKIFTRRFGNDCSICGYNYQRLFGVSPDYCNTYLFIPALECSDWMKRFVCVCRSCEEVLADDQGRFVEVLNERERKIP